MKSVKDRYKKANEPEVGMGSSLADTIMKLPSVMGIKKKIEKYKKPHSGSKPPYLVHLVHLRNINLLEPDPDGFEVFNVFKSKKYKWVTLAITIGENKLYEEDKLIACGFAACSMKDNPSRNFGLDKAMERMESSIKHGPQFIGYMDDKVVMKEIWKVINRKLRHRQMPVIKTIPLKEL